MKELWPLPANWRWAEFGEVARVDANLVEPAHHGQLPHIAPNHIESGTGRLLEYTTIANDGVTSGKHLFRAGHILYSKIRPYLAKAVVVDFAGLCSADMYPVSTDLETRFLHRWLVSPMFTEQAARNQGRTVLPKINKDALSRLPVPVPPRNEQRRIVAKLEALQAHSRRAREALDPVQPLLEKLRQSILASAFRGDLTKDWRENHPDAEPATELLKRIRIERRKKWEAAELAKMKAKGKSLADEKWKEKYEEPKPVEAAGLPDLPDGWCWARAEEVCQFITKGTTPSADQLKAHGQIPFIKVYNLTFTGRLDFSIDPTFIDREIHDGALARSRVFPGQVLMNIVGPPLGKVSIVPASYPEWNMNQAVAVFPLVAGLRAQYLAFHLLSARTVEDAVRAGKATAGQLNLTLEICRDLLVPICSEAEQDALVARVHSALITADRWRRELSNVADSLSSLERAVLAKAFRGELVPQHQNDEPEEMLARLRGANGITTNGDHAATRTRARRVRAEQVT